MNLSKIIAILLAGLLLVSLAACGKTASSSSGSSASEAVAETGRTSVLSTDWLAVQPEIDAQIIAEMGGGYTPEKPLVVVDPYKVAPLTALVVFDAEQSCTVSVTIPGKTEDTTFTHHFTEMQTHHEIPVYGLYAGETNTVELVLTYQDGKAETVTVPIQTESLPDNLPPYQVVVNEQGKVGGEGDELLYMAMTSGGVHPIAIDKQGDIRWYASNSDFSGGIFRRMQDGRFLAFTEAMYAPAISRTGVVRIDRMGKIYNEYLTALTHHDAIELPNGNLIIDTMKPGTESLLSGMYMGMDTLLEIDSKTGITVNEWDLNRIFGYRDADGKLLYTSGEGLNQFFHTNAVWYNEKDHSIIVSSPTMKVVVKFKADTKEIVWAMGDPRHGYPEVLQSKILKPIGDDFEWNGMQHAPMILPNGYIMLDDNGTGRLDVQGQPVPDADNYSRLVIYDVNEADMTIRQVYQYGKERGNELFATYVGDVDYLGENHYLLNAGGRIVDDAGIAQGNAYEGQMGIKRAEAKIVEIRDDKVVFEVYVGNSTGISFNNIYRVEWDSVYATNEKEYNLANTQAQRFGELAPSATVEFTLPAHYGELAVQVTNPVNYSYQLNVPVSVSGMEQGDVLLLELRGADQALYYPTTGMSGAQGIVRANGLQPGAYEINFVLQKANGDVLYAATEYQWVIA